MNIKILGIRLLLASPVLFLPVGAARASTYVIANGSNTSIATA
jgi:hypothetical protein